MLEAKRFETILTFWACFWLSSRVTRRSETVGFQVEQGRDSMRVEETEMSSHIFPEIRATPGQFSGPYLANSDSQMMLEASARSRESLRIILTKISSIPLKGWRFVV